MLFHEICGGGGSTSIHTIVWIRRRAIGKGIDFNDFGIRNGVDIYDFGISNGIDAFSDNWYKVGYTIWKNWYKERVCFRSFDGTSPSKTWSRTPPPPPGGNLWFSIEI